MTNLLSHQEDTCVATRSRHAPLFRRVGCGLFASLVWIAQLPSTQAEIIRNSPMIGFASGNLGVVGTGEGWAGSSSSYLVTAGSGSLDGVPLGLVASAGDKATIITNTGSLNTYNNFAAASGQFNGNTNLYYSFLIRFTNAADVDIAGEQIVSLNRLGSSSGIHFELLAQNVGGQVRLGANKPTGTAAYATTNIATGQTVFVVVRQQMLTGAGNDIIDIWINPAPTSFGLDEGSVPTPSISTSSGTEDTSGTGPGRFYLRSGTGFEFDELRITTTWAEATPTPALCDSAVVTSDPVDLTVVAGINASFSVTASGTSPSYLWQRSTNAGSTWNTISGAAGPGYSTPNLTTSDNGNKYRCIVSVSCNGSSATSAVATVTVQAPVATPPGSIMNDDWSDLDRTTGPVTPNNSVWFASSASSLTFNYVPGSLFGLPAAGSSRLWVGYFTDDTTTNLPVHLDVGTALKLTWVWNSDLINANSSGGLRVGLFDYADGGTRIAADGFGSGSTGNGDGVRGYMLVMDYASAFPDTTPFELRARTILDDNNLMGSTGNYPVTLASGPAELNGAAAFQNLTNYTLVMQVTRVAQNSVNIQATISGGGTNWTLSGTDNTYAYHRFDAFAVRPNSTETTAADFEFVNFKVEVVQATPPAIPLTIARAGSDVMLTWSDPQFHLQAASEVSGTYTNIAGATSPYTISAGEARKYFRLEYSIP